MEPTRRLLQRLALSGLCGLVVILAGCEEAAVKKYTAAREKPDPDVTRLFSYKVPDGWTRLPQPKEFSVATFRVGDGDKPVYVTLSRLPGNGGGLFANVMRWREKAGYSKPKPGDDKAEEQEMKEVKKVMEKMAKLPVDGKEAPYLDLHNPDNPSAIRILGVVADRGPVTWFVKMEGPPQQVGEQKTAFEAFVKSMQFGGTGAYQ